MANQPLTKLLEASEVAEVLGITEGTLAVWRVTGRYNLPYVKSGRLVRYRQADVDAFIAERTKGSVVHATAS